MMMMKAPKGVSVRSMFWTGESLVSSRGPLGSGSAKQFSDWVGIHSRCFVEVCCSPQSPSFVASVCPSVRLSVCPLIHHKEFVESQYSHHPRMIALTFTSSLPSRVANFVPHRLDFNHRLKRTTFRWDSEEFEEFWGNQLRACKSKSMYQFTVGNSTTDMSSTTIDIRGCDTRTQLW